MLAPMLAGLMMTQTQSLPLGVIQPFDWGTTQIPIHGSGQNMEVVDQAVEAAMRHYGVVGCGVAILKDGHMIYCKGFGFEQLPEKPFLPSTATRCGSIAKPMTSLCALSLMDEGKLNLDDRILPILAKVGVKPSPTDERVKQITVRELMDHTSGLPGGATYTSWRPGNNLIERLHLKQKPTSRDVAQDALANFRLDSDPGTAFQYANANFVILARVVEAASHMKFSDFLALTMKRFGADRDEIFVSRDQISPDDPARGRTEAAYYQTSAEQYCSFLPSDAPQGQVFGEAYRGYSTECSDGAGGIAISAHGLAKVLLALGSDHCPLSSRAMAEIITPPAHYSTEKGFDPASSDYYSKGFSVRYSGGIPWLSHGGMTNHCGGMIGYNAGYQFVTLSNWNNASGPYVDSILDRAVARAVTHL